MTHEESINYMCSHLYELARTMLEQCSNIDHTNYKDMDAYSKDFEMRWSKAMSLIDKVNDMMKR